MLSFIVPAHNEQACLGRTLQSIHESARAVNQPYEIIVADDASTDATAEIARQNNARVVSVNHRQIAATRNSGARAANGDRFFFVDADTIINPRVVISALRALDKGAVGGGAQASFDEVPLYAHLMLWWFNLFMRIGGISGGALMFCKRDAFNAVGGFDEKLFGAEDAALAMALRREGPFVVVWPRVLTSGRRMRGLRGLQMTVGLFRMAFFPGLLKKRSRVQKIWYDSDRQHDDKIGKSPAIFVLNVVMLVIVAVMITGPIWDHLVPWSWTPRDRALGKIRFGLAILSCHLGLVAWPCAYFLFRTLFRQRRWAERIKLFALMAVCVWLGWNTTQIVFWFWSWALKGFPA
jgi:glycosyltransferase involved in cell wall biosynthesis